MKKKKFIVAVSGGVDSVVLLHKLIANKPEYVDYIVAHVDHNVRKNSAQDAAFVEKMALKYNLLFRQTVLKIDKNDENSLRAARYEFLFSLKEEYNAESIITAHHQDDVLESMVINMLRGSSPRGLAPMTRKGILRPLLNQRKTELIAYANEHNLQWVEDETNDDEVYLRNYIRKNIMPHLESARIELLNINKKLSDLYEDIDIRVSHIVPKRNIMTRMTISQLPHIVAKEVMRAWLIGQGIENVDRTMIESAVVAAKALPHGKKVDLGRHHWLQSEKDVVQITKKTN